MKRIWQDITFWRKLRELYRHPEKNQRSITLSFDNAPGICQQVSRRNKGLETRRRRMTQFLNAHSDEMRYPRGTFWWEGWEYPSRAMACTRVLVQLRKEARRVRS